MRRSYSNTQILEVDPLTASQLKLGIALEILNSQSPTPKEMNSVFAVLRHFQVAPDGAVDVLGTSEVWVSQTKSATIFERAPVFPSDYHECSLRASCFLVSSHSWKLSGEKSRMPDWFAFYNRPRQIL